MTRNSDCLIVGGGVIGLSIAYQLARDGLFPMVIDRAVPGREASWAGAGILAPANAATAVHPWDALCALSHGLHADWAARLRAETGIDNGFRRCGGIYVARTAGEAASLFGLAALFAQQQIPFERLDAAALADREPMLAPDSRSGALRAAYYTPDEAQLRNPRHLQALVAACRKRGVAVEQSVEARHLVVRGGRIERVETSGGPLEAAAYCLTAGAWTRSLLEQLNIACGLMPVRGQMVLFRTPHPILRHVVNEGPRYLVPRDDGRLLAGSTEEEVGFDASTTDEAIQSLVDMATSLVPALKQAAIENRWAGLRPGSYDGMPYLGRVPRLENAFVAAGHYRSGLHLSTGTGVVMSQLIRGLKPPIDLSPFEVGRGGKVRDAGVEEQPIRGSAVRRAALPERIDGR